MQLLRGKFHKTEAAFTLIELLIVISIVALLTALATNNYLTAQKRSRDSGRKASVNTIAGAVETYYSVKMQFPGDAFTPNNKLVPFGYPNSGILYNECEEVNTVAGSNGGKAPLYVYIPGQDCSGGTMQPKNSTYFAYDPTEYGTKGSGVWIPGLGSYLNPFPTEPRFTNISGTSATTDVYSRPYDVMDQATDACVTANQPPGSCGNDRQQKDPSRTLYYRNLQSGYLLYARLESDQDNDFNTQFTGTSHIGSVCLDNTLSGVIKVPDQLSCVPTIAVAPNNPIILYLLRK